MIGDDEPIKDMLDPNYPLYIMMKETAPGTFSHCKEVADILDIVANELGLDARKLKTAGLYHDIGKTHSPLLFSENQPQDENIHDSLDPWISYNLITGHVAHTIQILFNDPNVHKDVVAWCAQHHGTTLAAYFFKKSESKDEASFRYKGQRPQSFEALLLMYCDHLESRMRSERRSGRITCSEDVDSLVEIVFNQLLDDDQFDDVAVPSFKVLRRLKQILKRELCVRFEDHKRIDYAGEVQPKQTSEEKPKK